MKIIMPMAGLGSRFIAEGISTPKPLIVINGKYMFEWAIDSVKNLDYSQFIFVVLKEHEKIFNLSKIILEKTSINNSKVILLDEVTEGQLISVLTAREHINTDEDILIIPTDTYIVSDIQNQIKYRPKKCRGIISVIEKPGNQWSFAKINNDNEIIQVAEKERISNLASTGMYYFASGIEFIKYADQMVLRGEKSKGEFYIIPVYKNYIEDKKTININIAKEMWDLGTPKSAKAFELDLLKNSNRTE